MPAPDRDLFDLTRSSRRWELPAVANERGLLVAVGARRLLGHAVGEVNRPSLHTHENEVVEIFEAIGPTVELELRARTDRGEATLEPFGFLPTRGRETADETVLELHLEGFFGGVATWWLVHVDDRFVAGSRRRHGPPDSRFTLPYGGFLAARAGLTDWREVLVDGGSVDAALPDIVGALGAALAAPPLDADLAHLIGMASGLVTQAQQRTPRVTNSDELAELVESWPDLATRWQITLIETAAPKRWHPLIEMWSSLDSGAHPTRMGLAHLDAACVMPGDPQCVRAITIWSEEVEVWTPQGTKPRDEWGTASRRFLGEP